MSGFFSLLEERSGATASRLCVGLDPRHADPLKARRHCLDLIDATAPFAAAFKPNAAFFEALGPPGMEVLVEVVAGIPDEIPVLLDAKRGDIASSAAAYATAAFDVIGAGAVTVSPYLGKDSIEPFLAHGAVWVLCRTSNPGGAEIQDLVENGITVAERVAAAAAGWAGPERLGLVVGATMPEALASVRHAAPEHWILAPGVGPQGADLAETGAGLREDGSGLLLPVSRLIADSDDPAATAAGLARAFGRLPATTGTAAPGLATRLHDAGCVRFGEFALKSGAVSPVYIDLRRLPSTPPLLRTVAAMLGSRAVAVGADHVGAVPLAALPIATAVSLHTGLPLVWPRPSKEHGGGETVQGVFEPGDRVVLVDDVATTGSSAIAAARVLREAGLVVEDLVVLVERGPTAHSNLEEAGIALHAVTDLRQVTDDLAEARAIDAAQHRAVLDFL